MVDILLVVLERGPEKTHFESNGVSRAWVRYIPLHGLETLHNIMIIHRIETFTLLSGSCIFLTTADSISIWYCIFSSNSLMKHSS